MDPRRAGKYILLPLYIWNAFFVLGTCAMSPWVFNTNAFWMALFPTCVLLGASVMAELLMIGIRVRLIQWFFRFFLLVRPFPVTLPLLPFEIQCVI